MGWRGDKPASLYYVVALDEGDQAKKVDNRDELFSWDAPFTNEASAPVGFPSSSKSGADTCLVLIIPFILP